MKRIIYIFTLLILACACQKEYVKVWGLNVNSNEYILSNDTESIAITVYCSGDWQAQLTLGSEWAVLDKTSGSGVKVVHVTFGINKGLSRACELLLTSEGQPEQRIKITQKTGVANPRIEFQMDKAETPCGSYDVLIPFATNIPSDNFRGVTPEVTVSGEWLSDVVVSEREDSLHSESMPDGILKYVSARMAKNASGEERSAKIVIKLSNGSGNVYADSVILAQGTTPASIQIGERDIVNKPGGSRSANFTTNLNYSIDQIQTVLSYEDPTAADWISNLKREGTTISYDIAENNSGKYRYANIEVKFTDLDGDVVSAKRRIEQNLTPEDFSNFEIRSIDEFEAWNASYAKWAATDNISLMADIDCKGANIIGHEFLGTFNGNGHCIYNFAISGDAQAVFFSALKGTAKFKDVFFGTSDKASYDGTSTIMLNSNSDGVAAIFGSVQDAAGVSGVVNYAKVGATRLGGVSNIAAICAQLQGDDAAISNCANFGEVTVGTASTKNLFLGGVVANVIAGTLSSCSNAGDVSNSGTCAAAAIVAIGGVVGNVTGQGTVLIDQIANEGTVSNSGSVAMTGSYLRLGGLIGRDAWNHTFSNSANTGDVVNTGAAYALSMGGAIGEDCGNPMSCSKIQNTGNVSNGASCASTYCIAGISGSATQSSTLTSCANKGKVNAGGTGTNVIAAGVVATASGMLTLEGSSNSGNVTSVATASGYNCAGGIVGFSNKALTIKAASGEKSVNSGEITVNSNVAKLVYIGGAIGYQVTTAGASVSDFFNYGKISALSSGTNVFLGGAVGYTAVNIAVSDCENKGEIVNEAAGQFLYIAGIVGNAAGGVVTATNCVNNGPVLLKGASDRASGQNAIRTGGVIGATNKAAVLKNCVNNASVVNEGNSLEPCLGGVIGYNNGAASKLYGCKNTGLVKSVTTGSVLLVRLGGIFGTSTVAAEMYGCQNSGNVINEATSATTADLGGFVGNAAAVKITVDDNNTVSSSKCSISSTGASTANMGQAIGTSKSAALINKTGFGGSVGGTALTSDNYSSFIVGAGSTPTVTDVYFVN